MQQHNLCELCLKFGAELYVCYATGALFQQERAQKAFQERIYHRTRRCIHLVMDVGYDDR